ncbi:PaaI family thioesterase [Spirochaetia bacterium 38H-sp]|uniref:Acyl-coenzyme A thioesterase THEM4 n=1 Tax=Rarispira pelagica TaxID=3141764 RepID=A0ABU9U8K4_9SPIR
MKRINNPYTGLEGYNCFGCSPHNMQGLRMDFFLEGDTVVCKWKPQTYFEGYSGVLHGGIQATLLDEAASWVLFTVLGTSGSTTELSVHYKKPVMLTNQEITIKARVEKTDKNLVYIKAELIDSNGTVCTKADITYFSVPEHIARRRFAYPGKEAFFAKKEI